MFLTWIYPSPCNTKLGKQGVLQGKTDTMCK